MGCDFSIFSYFCSGSISIHAPIVGCDFEDFLIFDCKINFNPRTHRGVRLINGTTVYQSNTNFNPRTHRGVRHRKSTVFTHTVVLFQSTHPSWGATLRTAHIALTRQSNFNPRTHRGVRQQEITITACSADISIHAPIVGCDKSSLSFISQDLIFQSTHPSWGATELAVKYIE